MTGEWEALIGADFMRGGVNIVWAQDMAGGRQVSNGSTVWIVTDEPSSSLRVEPLTLRDDMARSLLAALLRHYNGADDARMLRRDYDAERARVDRLITALIPVALTPANSYEGTRP